MEIKHEHIQCVLLAWAAEVGQAHAAEVITAEYLRQGGGSLPLAAGPTWNNQQNIFHRWLDGSTPQRQAKVRELLPASIADAEQTQKREHYQKRDRLKNTENGTVSGKKPKNGIVKSSETIPFFPSNDPKNGIRNPPEESKDLNPTHNVRESLEVEPVKQAPVPEYPGQPGIAYPAAPPLGKFPMTAGWAPSPDFRQRAAYWGQPVPETMERKTLLAALASFTDYWISEGKVFSQTQWEQKFARHLQNAKPTPPRGNTHAGLDEYPATYNAAQRKMLDARRAQLRARGQSVEVLGAHGGNLLQPVGGQKRLGPVGPMDCSDWEFDQRPDDERL